MKAMIKTSAILLALLAVYAYAGEKNNVTPVPASQPLTLVAQDSGGRCDLDDCVERCDRVKKVCVENNEGNCDRKRNKCLEDNCGDCEKKR